MTRKEKDSLCAKLNWEGGFEAFITYSSFPEIKDSKFRQLVESYIRAYQELSGYIGWDAYEG